MKRSLLISGVVILILIVAILAIYFPRWLTGRATAVRPDVGTKYTVQASAYASSPYQTDSTPCITAAGTRVREGVIATNFLPMGTIVSYDGNLYIVEDRMNSRYAGYYLDFWMTSTSKAREFGRKNITVTIEGYGEPGQVITVDASGTVIEPSFLKRASLRFLAYSRTAENYLKASIYDQYDVDCLGTE